MSAGSLSPLRSLSTIQPDVALKVVVFQWQDRWAHQVLAGLPGQAMTLIAETLEDATVEGVSDDWPSSPPLQQIDRCILGNGQEGLVAVGLAGVGHWSAAFEADDRGLTWDIACRTPKGAPFLGSTYRLTAPNQWRHVGNRLQGNLSAGTASLALELRVDKGILQWHPAAGMVVLRADGSQDSFPATVRWKYGFAQRNLASND